MCTFNVQLILGFSESINHLMKNMKHNKYKSQTTFLNKRSLRKEKKLIYIAVYF